MCDFGHGPYQSTVFVTSANTVQLDDPEETPVRLKDSCTLTLDADYVLIHVWFVQKAKLRPGLNFPHISSKISQDAKSFFSYFKEKLIIDNHNGK